ncbi:MAG: hypothetical protein EXX96DRAFT_590536 [Benjaminiella poitrasii]|nr:MAG: hypothetical protein EXX96DRAFT_590536 [Benjaminiella poitrasii]
MLSSFDSSIFSLLTFFYTMNTAGGSNIKKVKLYGMQLFKKKTPLTHRHVSALSYLFLSRTYSLYNHLFSQAWRM